MFRLMEPHPNRIHELRRAADLSQQALADRMGTTKMSVSELERGERELTLSWMRRLADALAVTPADLLTPDDNPMQLDADEQHLVERWRAAEPEQREQLEKVADVLIPWRPQRDAA